MDGPRVPWTQRLRSRLRLPLTLTTLLVVGVGIILPYVPFAGDLGFAPLPALYFLFLMGMTISYLLLVELVKRRLMGRWLNTNAISHQ